MSHCSRNQLPKPAGVKGLANSVTKNVRWPLGVASMIFRNVGVFGDSQLRAVVRSVFPLIQLSTSLFTCCGPIAITSCRACPV